MFDIGFFEVTIIAIVALLVIGPERLPEVARTLGMWIGRFKQMTRQLSQELDREVERQELEQELRKHFPASSKDAGNDSSSTN